MNRVEVAWAAGLFEGEGSIGMYRARGKTPILQLSMTDEDVVLRFQATIGMGRIDGPYVRKDGTKPQWAWHATSFEKVQALLAIGEVRNAPVKQALRVVCPSGHRYTHRDIRGSRVCRECQNRANRESKARRRAV